jgi:hypothetical protein
MVILDSNVLGSWSKSHRLCENDEALVVLEHLASNIWSWVKE